MEFRISEQAVQDRRRREAWARVKTVAAEQECRLSSREGWVHCPAGGYACYVNEVYPRVDVSIGDPTLFLYALKFVEALDEAGLNPLVWLEFELKDLPAADTGSIAAAREVLEKMEAPAEPHDTPNVADILANLSPEAIEALRQAVQKVHENVMTLADCLRIDPADMDKRVTT